MRMHSGVIAGWTPLALSPALWLAADAGTFQSSGGAAASTDADPIGEWRDQSGNGRHATMTGSNRPAYKLVGGRPSVRFTTASLQYMVVGGSALNIRDNCTVFAVFKPTTTIRQTILGQGNTTGAFQLEVNLANPNTIINGVVISAASDQFTALSALAQRMICYRRSGAGATSDWRINGSSHAPTVTNSATAFSADGTAEIGRRAAASQHLNGDLFALLVFTQSLTNAEIVQVEEYLRAAYAVAFQLQLLDLPSSAAVADKAQGVAYDGTYYYLSTDTKLHKLTRSGSTYTTVLSRTITGDNPTGKTQLTGMHYYGGYLWCGANSYPATSPAAGWIVKYNPADLTWVATYPTQAHQCEGARWKDLGDGNGPNLWAIYNDWGSVSRYDASLNHVADYALPLYSGFALGYQGIIWLGNDLITPEHRDNNPNDRVHVHTWNGTGFDGVIKLIPPATASGQGCDWEGTGSPSIGDVLLFAERITNTDARIVRATYRYVH